MLVFERIRMTVSDGELNTFWPGSFKILQPISAAAHDEDDDDTGYDEDDGDDDHDEFTLVALWRGDDDAAA